jgi:alkylated DNA repair dioxygenase AlkB
MNGLSIFENFIDEKEEKELLEFIYNQQWSNALSRRVQHYGYEYSYFPPYTVKKTVEIPEIFQNYINQIDESFNQVIVNEYLPGQGIGKHVDHKKLFGDTISSLSLGSATTMIFSYGKEKYEYYIKPRTLIIMEDDARWKYAHEIPARKKDNDIERKTRVSLTFRTVV